MLNLDDLIVIKITIMAKKIKSTSQKSLKKTLLSQIEGKLTKSLKEFPKKISEKKYRKTIHKAGKLLTNSIALKPVKATSKSDQKKSGKKKQEVQESQETKTEVIS
jgi:hypothetical protein